MVTDPIADMLTRIRNAYTARLSQTKIPHSQLKNNLAQILKDEGYIQDFSVETAMPSQISVVLKYGGERKAAMSGIRRTSRPGRRVYVGHREIPQVNNGLGVAILSTSRGIMTDKTARREHIGGEVLCEVW